MPPGPHGALRRRRPDSAIPRPHAAPGSPAPGRNAEGGAPGRSRTTAPQGRPAGVPGTEGSEAALQAGGRQRRRRGAYLRPERLCTEGGCAAGWLGRPPGSRGGARLGGRPPAARARACPPGRGRISGPALYPPRGRAQLAEAVGRLASRVSRTPGWAAKVPVSLRGWPRREEGAVSRPWGRASRVRGFASQSPVLQGEPMQKKTSASLGSRILAMKLQSNGREGKGDEVARAMVELAFKKMLPFCPGESTIS